MNRDAAHTSQWEIAEIVFGIPILLCLILGYLFPLPLSPWLPRIVTTGIGILLILTGIVIIVKTRQQFHRASQPTNPGRPTTLLITSGLFSWSRNPLYLGAVAAFLGLGALLDSLWFFIFLIPTMAATYFILIAPEERYLEEKFGEPYRAYTKSVRRWIGRRG